MTRNAAHLVTILATLVAIECVTTGSATAAPFQDTDFVMRCEGTTTTTGSRSPSREASTTVLRFRPSVPISSGPAGLRPVELVQKIDGESALATAANWCYAECEVTYTNDSISHSSDRNGLKLKFKVSRLNGDYTATSEIDRLGGVSETGRCRIIGSDIGATSPTHEAMKRDWYVISMSREQLWAATKDFEKLGLSGFRANFVLIPADPDSSEMIATVSEVEFDCYARKRRVGRVIAINSEYVPREVGSLAAAGWLATPNDPKTVFGHYMMYGCDGDRSIFENNMGPVPVIQVIREVYFRSVLGRTN